MSLRIKSLIYRDLLGILPSQSRRSQSTFNDMGFCVMMLAFRPSLYVFGIVPSFP